jgi:hypothetical protein
MRGAWFAARHRRGLMQAAAVARAANDDGLRSRAGQAARSARTAMSAVSRARVDQETMESLSEILENVAVTLRTAEAQMVKRRRRKRMRRFALGATVVGAAALGVWQRSRSEAGVF